MLTRFLLLFACMLLPVQSWAAVAYVATGNGSCWESGVACTAGNTTLTYAVNVGAGSERQIAVFTFVGCGSADTAPAVTSVTYAGQALSLITSETSSSGRKSYLHTWPASSMPTSGANDVVVVVASNVSNCTGSGPLSSIQSGAIAATGVDQTTAITSSATNTGSSTSPTVTISTNGADDLGVHAVCNGVSITSTSTGTQRWDSDFSGNSCGSSGGASANGGTTTYNWTTGNDTWTIIGAAFKASGGGGGPDTTQFYKRRGQ